MRGKSNKALRRSAQLAATASISRVVARPDRRLGATTVAAAVAGILYGSASGIAYAADQAQAAAAAPAAPGGESLQEVVVTATATGVKKLDASYNIVSVDAEAIKQANPKSTADLLKVSPGIWPESSGGQTGANIEIAGFPGGGDAPYFTNMIQGLPMYGMPSLSFMDSSSFLRLDDTIERVEVVQTGPGALFGPGQMGATANFILKRGSETPAGSIGETWGDEGLWRTDGFYGFKIADGWYGSVGGFYRDSKGVRPPQFSADQGGQLTGTISHDLDGGSLMVWARVTDDHNQFMVPIPVIENGNGNISAYPGFDPLHASYGSFDIQNVTLPNPQGGFEGANLANGRGTQFEFFGINWNQQFNDWHLTNNFMIDGGGLDTNALFSGPNPRPLSYYLYGCQVPAPAGYCNGATAVDTNNYSLNAAGIPTVGGSNGAGNGQGLPLNTVTATYANNGAAVPLGASVIQQGWWYIQKSLSSVTDEFRASREIFPGNTLTPGVYFAKYNDNDNWSLGNQMLMTNTPNATAIALRYTQPVTGTVYNLSSPQGFVNMNGNYNILAHGNATNLAGYLSDSWRINGWLFDGGVRVENIDVHQRTCNRTNTQMGTAADLYENAVPLCNATNDYEHYVHTMPTYTFGANYEFSNYMSAYVRINDGHHYDDFDNNIRGANGNYAPLQNVQNYEGGFKFQNRYAYVDVSIYERDFTGLQYTPSDQFGVPIPGETLIYGAKTKGMNAKVDVAPLQGLDILLLADYMDGHYTDYTGCIPYTDILGNRVCAPINGAPLQRQPKWHVEVTPRYTAPVSWGDITGFVTYEYVGQRYEDIAGLAPLGTYYMLDAGLIFDVGRNWQFRAQGTNLTNQIGLTEGNARIFGSAVGLGGVLMARPIEGREINLTAYYKF
jgi:outer membrane receptor protein involved in Fe transport